MHVDVSGSCHCSAITFTARINPEYVVICHCTDCQIFSSAPYRVSVPVKAENFRLTGTPYSYVKVADSGRKRLLAFCGVCGSALYSTSVEAEPELFNLRWGVIHQRSELPPRLQGFCGSGVDWAVNIEAVPEVPIPSSTP